MVAKKARPPKAAKPVETATNQPEETYEVVLKTQGKSITVMVRDRVLYPLAVAWNRLLSADKGRQHDEEQEKQSWRKTGREAILKLARAGEVSDDDATEFIAAAARGGEVQVEMEWKREAVGYAARVFPWEALIALATKSQRELSGNQGIVVVRWLKGGPQRPVAAGPAGFAVSASAEQAGFDTATERAAIAAALRGKLAVVDLRAKTLAQLEKSIEGSNPPPSIVHYVLIHTEEIAEPSSAVGARNADAPSERIAQTVAAQTPELATFSTCHSGRRLAPLAIAHGAQMALGFHGWVMDASCPAFFGAFYRAWKQDGESPLDALRTALSANQRQPRPDDLGVVTLWSSFDLFATRRAGAGKVRSRRAPSPSSATKPTMASLHVNCELEASLNYSMLHNKSGGIFKNFLVTKLAPGRMADLEVTVKIDTGFERAVECHFFTSLREEANSVVELASKVMLPLGSELLRRRGEMLRGTVEIAILCEQVRLFHQFGSIQLPPCDEWKDDEAGRRFLPSFIFPRDPAVRDILTAAQPFLRALTDDPLAGFDGYQQSFAGAGIEAVRWQLRAIWTALQTTCRLDYVNPPPSYASTVQRLRTPEEILRARRGTCIELALLLAACWEHIGINPVIFLIPGHAFVGYWTSDDAWTRFYAELVKRGQSMEPGKEGIDDDEALSDSRAFDPSTMSGGGILPPDQGWVLKGTHHLAMIHREVAAKNLIPVEATAVALQKPFGVAEHEGTDLLLRVRNIADFDGMIDAQKARKEGVTPLAILTQNVVA